MLKRFPHFILLSLVVLMIDQATKHLIEARFEYAEIKTVIAGFFDLTLRYNPGAAFSFLADAGGWQRYFFTGLALVISGVLVFLIKKHQAETRYAVAMSLIMAGALGNAIDRMVFGHVIDFLLFHWQNQWYYPAFNIADSAICIGAALLVIDSFKKSEKPE